SWQQPPSGSVTLSEDLSGVTLLESVAAVFGDSAITEVRREGSTVPRTFHLYQNYPNPFNPSTDIKVSLKQAGAMSLMVYNVLGQVVDVVAQGYKPAGEYTYNVNMDKFASGVYFYTLRQGTGVITREMLLLK
ncbi:MAG: T9SS type A sorting domain-containing protein, partial [Bacteroidetes bacterium]|nr:T9SS type A sorting domain-containing protein [Bacteroidota bacterium]